MGNENKIFSSSRQENLEQELAYKTFGDWLKDHGPSGPNVEVILPEYISDDVEVGFSAVTFGYNGNRSDAKPGEAVVGTIMLWKILGRGSLLKNTIDDAQDIKEFKGKNIPGILKILEEKYGYVDPHDDDKIEKMQKIEKEAEKLAKKNNNNN